jgi:GntR family transcriptional regulator/MocR family aminotransferase
MPVVTALYRYPVKGLSAQPVESARLSAGAPFPFDRVMALARPRPAGGPAVDPDAPRWAKKGLFVMLMLDEGLARVRTHLDEETLRLTVSDGTRTVLAADLADAEDRARAEAFFHRLAPTLPAPPRLVRARESGHFMDKPDNVISMINLATLRTLEQHWGVTLDPLRFRANIYIDGAAPWAEFDWIGGDITIGAGSFHVDRRNGRCGATNVDPATGRRDLDIPRSLRATFGHKDLGVYLVADDDATLSVGDALDPPGHRRRSGAAMAEPAAAPTAAPVSHAFMCRGCYHVYDEARGLPDTGIAPGTRFIDIPTAWRCPDCGTDKGKFRPHGG